MEMPLGVQTADLLSAQCDYPRPPPQFKNKQEVLEKKADRVLCTTWNSCSTEGKCDYEVNNPGKECNRRHECTWCRKSLKQGFRHQKRFCKKNEAAGH